MGQNIYFKMGVHKTNTNHLLNTLNQDLNSKKPECFRERSKRKNSGKASPISRKFHDHLITTIRGQSWLFLFGQKVSF